MNNKNEFTVKELAEELSITPQALQNRINNIPNFRDAHITKPAKHRIIIDNEGAELLRNYNHDQKNSNPGNPELIEILKQENKNKQKEIDKLLTLLDQSQRLEIADKQEIKQLKEQLQLTFNLTSTDKVDYNQNNEKEPENTTKSTKKEESKYLNFLQRLTKRFKS